MKKQIAELAEKQKEIGERNVTFHGRVERLLFEMLDDDAESELEKMYKSHEKIQQIENEFYIRLQNREKEYEEEDEKREERPIC